MKLGYHDENKHFMGRMHFAHIQTTHTFTTQLFECVKTNLEGRHNPAVSLQRDNAIECVVEIAECSVTDAARIRV